MDPRLTFFGLFTEGCKGRLCKRSQSCTSHMKKHIFNKYVYILCISIFTYIHIYMYIILYHIQHIGIPNFRILGYCFEKSSCNGEKKRGLEPTMAPATSGSLSAGRQRSSQHFSETRKSKREFATVVLGEPINH
jgi:hypothetical protein